MIFALFCRTIYLYVHAIFSEKSIKLEICWQHQIPQPAILFSIQTKQLQLSQPGKLQPPSAMSMFNTSMTASNMRTSSIGSDGEQQFILKEKSEQSIWIPFFVILMEMFGVFGCFEHS